MAFSGIAITAGYAGSLTNRGRTLAIPGKALWTETSSLPYTTTQIAPGSHDSAGDPTFTVVADVDTWVSIAPAPNASTGPRYLIKAGVERTIYAQPNDKLAAVAA